MTIALAANASLGVVLPAVFSANLGLVADLRGRIDVAAAGVASLQAKLQVEASAALALQAGIHARVAAQAEIVANLDATLTASLEMQLTPPALVLGAALSFAASAAADLEVSLQGPNFALDLAAGIGDLQANLSGAITTSAALSAELSASVGAGLALAASIQAEITAQLALVASLQAEFTIALGIGDFFAAAGVRLYTFDGTLSNFGAESTTYLATPTGAAGMAGAVKGIVILTDVPASAAALGFVLGV